jgi:hypothetical protein
MDIPYVVYSMYILSLMGREECLSKLLNKEVFSNVPRTDSLSTPCDDCPGYMEVRIVRDPVLFEKVKI